VLLEHDWAQRTLPQGLVVASGMEWETTIETHITSDELASIRNLDQRLYVVGLMDYFDLLGERRSTGFCWHYSEQPGAPGSFIITPDTPLNHYT